MAQIKAKLIEELKELAKSMPKKPGCYLFKNKLNEIIYVGKAKNLNSRVKSYFASEHKDSPKTRILVEKICDIEFQLTESESEALILENNLIKKYLPKYNIRLKDDKSYPYVIVKKNDPFPRLEFRRRVKKDRDNFLFGPFVHGSNIFGVLRELTRSFRLRDCGDFEFKSRKDPCLLYQMKQCSAPCVKYISPEDYQKDLSLALSVLKGNGGQAISYLMDKMYLASEEEKFEQAAFIRDSIEVIRQFVENFSRAGNKEANLPASMDIISIYDDGNETDISVTIIRNNIILGQKSFYFFTEDFGESLDDGLMNFCFQYYGNSEEELPEKLILDLEKQNFELMADAVEKFFERKIALIRPMKKWQRIIDLNKEQAYQSQRLRKLNRDHHFKALSKLKELAHLKELPKHIECYDIAIWQGRSPTASQIVFRNGLPEKSSYRYYHLETRDEGNNDFAMLSEVINRRVQKGDLPDIFVIDGGKGQVSAVLKTLEKNNLTIPVVGIAKSKTKANFRQSKLNATSERLVIPGRKNDYELSQSMSLFRLITQMRDEAHRFSRKLHHKKEKTHHFSSFLDEIDGIGQKTKEKILKNLHHEWKFYKNFTYPELQKEFGIGEKIAKSIFEKLKKNFSK